MTRVTKKSDGPLFTEEECDSDLSRFLKDVEVKKLSRQLRKDVEKMYDALESFYNAIDLTAYRRNLLKYKSLVIVNKAIKVKQANIATAFAELMSKSDKLIEMSKQSEEVDLSKYR